MFIRDGVVEWRRADAQIMLAVLACAAAKQQQFGLFLCHAYVGEKKVFHGVYHGLVSRDCAPFLHQCGVNAHRRVCHVLPGSRQDSARESNHRLVG